MSLGRATRTASNQLRLFFFCYLWAHLFSLHSFWHFGWNSCQPHCHWVWNLQGCFLKITRALFVSFPLLTKLSKGRKWRNLDYRAEQVSSFKNGKKRKKDDQQRWKKKNVQGGGGKTIKKKDYRVTHKIPLRIRLACCIKTWEYENVIWSQPWDARRFPWPGPASEELLVCCAQQLSILQQQRQQRERERKNSEQVRLAEGQLC